MNGESLKRGRDSAAKKRRFSRTCFGVKEKERERTKSGVSYVVYTMRKGCENRSGPSVVRFVPRETRILGAFLESPRNFAP